MNSAEQPGPGPEHWVAGETCCNERWERAHERFESPREERAKMRRRLRKLGADDWPRELRLLSLFCGKGAELSVLHRMGFRNLTGVDLSPSLLVQCPVPARLIVGDCTDLRFEKGSFDRVLVQGGLHHLPKLPGDLDRCLDHIKRVLVPGGELCLVEPWHTPFLGMVHFACERRLPRMLWPKLDALATMIDEERTTYFNWLSSKPMIIGALRKRFKPVTHLVGGGKIFFVGKPRV